MFLKRGSNFVATANYNKRREVGISCCEADGGNVFFSEGLVRDVLFLFAALFFSVFSPRPKGWCVAIKIQTEND